MNQTSKANAAKFAAGDFLKMFAAAIGSGIAVSLAAAAIALALSGSAQASERAALAADAVVADLKSVAAPGGLYIGGACDRDPVDVLERDWQIRIDGDTAEVRVMQSFLMPDEGEGLGNISAFFEATLPRGAQLKSLKAHAGNTIRSGELVRLNKVTSFNRAQLSAIEKRNGLLMWNDEGAVQTDQITNIAPGESVVVEYTYTINVANGQSNALDLALTETQHDAFDSNRNARPVTAAAHVWVKWIGAKPQYLSGFPDDSVIEKTINGATGLSWSSLDLSAGKKFSLAWIGRNTTVAAR